MQVFAIFFLMFAVFAVLSGIAFHCLSRRSNPPGVNFPVVCGVSGCVWAYSMDLSVIVGGIVGVAGSILGICIALFVAFFSSKRGRF